MGEWYESVQLQPFEHQVSGQTGIFQFDDWTLCKPLNTKEKDFYLTLPQNLKQFTAEFRETIEGKVCENGKGYLTILYHRSLPESPTCENLKLNQERNAEKEGQRSLQLVMNGENGMNSQAAQNPDSIYELRPENLNPWISRCHGKMLKKLRKVNQSPAFHCKFILLENLAAKYSHPSIIDLKMGTMQHGDDFSPEKKEKAIRKCQNTTSSSLGVRVCGMKVYQEDSDKYICVNKYYGRSLGVDGFKQTLQQFLHNGYEPRKDLLDSIIKKLKDLHGQVQSLDTYRFYSSSLLVMYDVRSQDKDVEEASAQSNIVDVRMIDFAHSTHSGFQNDTRVHTGPDQGYLYGLKSLIDVFTNMR
ncbi:inositol hexakisphosphate kinase 2-like [Saccostrea cucullata]|uniref:inositol hexakisphosphate kinase 2-like n=1 Tax=Saccostrea cuccullata TaxID=36930 RepID=UPI002ED325C1